MNVVSLHQCFLGTLQANAEIRTQAEQQLKSAQKERGFLACCLDILNSADIELPVKKACLIYFKNIIIKNWRENGSIDHDEKPIVRERLLATIVHSDRSTKAIFIPILNEILVTDYPTEWPDFLDSTTRLFANPNDLDSLYTGMLCFSELCRKYRWMKNEDRSSQLDSIIKQYFSSLLQIGGQIISDSASSDSHWQLPEILKLILKSYKFVTYLDLPEPLQEEEAISNWIGFHVAVMNISLPSSAMQLDEEERHLSPWVKSQKWAYANILNIYVRYGSKGWLSDGSYTQFRALFSSSVVPELLKTYFGKIEEWRQGHRWISDASLYHIISFIEHAVTRKSSWGIIQPFLNNLISELAFPIFYPKDSVLELFEDDPQEYIMMTFTIEETSNSPVTAVRNLIATLAEKRKDTALEPILQFAYGKLNSLTSEQDTINVARQRESALRIIGCISSQLVEEQSPFKDQMEAFLSALVFPNFKSRFGFLRARTCNVSSKFSKLSFTDPNNLSVLFQGVMNCFNDSGHLPVQFEGALAIQSFIDFPQFKEALGSIIVPTTEKLLTLSGAIDSDLIPSVIQSCVENYSEQLEPFGISLTAKLSEQLMKLLEELNEAQSADPDDFDSDELGSKTNAALGIFSTLLTVLLYFENSAQKIAKLEQIYAPVLHYVLAKDLDSFFAETFEMLENTTFLTRNVSPTMWSLFEDSLRALMNSDLSLNLEDAMPALKNYMVYGASTIKTNSEYQQAMIGMVMKVFNKDGDFAPDDVMNAAELSTYIILALDSNSAGPYVPHLVKKSLEMMTFEEAEQPGNVYKIIIANVIIASLVVDPNHCLQTLIETSSTDSFFNLWNELCTSYKRVFDMKLSIMGLLSFLSIDMESLSQMNLEGVIPQFGKNLTILLTAVPKAISELEKKRKEMADTDGSNEITDEFIFGDNDEDSDEDENNEQENRDLAEAAETGGFVLDDDYIEQYGFATDDTFDEDPYANTPLDNLNIFKTFKDFILSVQASDSNKYSSIISQLNPEQMDTISNIVQIASN